MTMLSAPRPRKTIGQHFLIDPNIVRKTLDLSALQYEELVLEVGPGRGILTRALCRRVRRVIAVEIDPRLVEYLKHSLADCPNLELHLGDALEFPYESLPEDTVVVANLPYYVSTPLLFRILESRDRFSRLIVMLQAEVAARLIAQPGTSQYGILSVLIQAWAIPSLGFRVSPGCFRPRPDVTSAVVHLTIRKGGGLRLPDDQTFARTVRAAFSHRRKTLANSLRHAGLPAGTVALALAEAGIEPTRRAETLSLEDFSTLAAALSAAQGS